MNGLRSLFALFVLLLPGVGAASAAPVTWDLTAPGFSFLGTSETFTGSDGSGVTVEAFSLRPGEASWDLALINQTANGLGVSSQFFDSTQIDNYRTYELLRFELPAASDAGSMLLTLGFTNDDYLIWANDTGALPDVALNLGGLNGDVLASGGLTTSPETVFFAGDTAFNYLFVGGDLATFCGCGIWEADDFKVAGLSAAVSVVPLPAAMPLFAAAIGLFGLVGMRRKYAPKVIEA